MIDAFCLGRKSVADTHSHPRPVLIKLESCWDKRLLLAACRKLKAIRIINFLLVKTFHLKRAIPDVPTLTQVVVPLVVTPPTLFVVNPLICTLIL